MSHALIVEDDAGTAEMLAALVAAEGFTTATAASLQQARRELESQRPDVVLLDLSLPDGSGIDLFDAVETPDPACEIVLITGHASLETSIQALRLGAADYLRKPVDVARLRAVLARAGGASEVRGRMDRERSLVDAQGRFGRIWGRSQSMREIYRRIERVAALHRDVDRAEFRQQLLQREHLLDSRKIPGDRADPLAVGLRDFRSNRREGF